jgi:hypothetical protein
MYFVLFNEEEKFGYLYTVRNINESESRVLQEHKSDLKEFSLVCIVKFVLTEGEKFIIFAFRDFVRAILWFNKI